MTTKSRIINGGRVAFISICYRTTLYLVTHC